MSSVNNSSVLRAGGKVVGAVHSPEALASALRLAPGQVDFFEIRVDSFAADPAPVLRALPKLRAPLIITVRHPAEGGANDLGFAERRELFAQFLPFAAFIDIELRSVKALASTAFEARQRGVKIIVSHHSFHSMPSSARLQLLIRRAHAAGADVFKIAARAESPAQLATLFGLLASRSPLPLSVMGMGKFGKISRLLFAQAGSVLNYGYLNQPNASGQWEATLLKKRIGELGA